MRLDHYLTVNAQREYANLLHVTNSPVCVLGLGLIGGSVLRAAAKAGREVFGYNRSVEAVQGARFDGFDATAPRGRDPRTPAGRLATPACSSVRRGWSASTTTSTRTYGQRSPNWRLTAVRSWCLPGPTTMTRPPPPFPTCRTLSPRPSRSPPARY